MVQIEYTHNIYIYTYTFRVRRLLFVILISIQFRNCHKSCVKTLWQATRMENTINYIVLKVWLRATVKATETQCMENEKVKYEMPLIARWKHGVRINMYYNINYNIYVWIEYGCISTFQNKFVCQIIYLTTNSLHWCTWTNDVLMYINWHGTIKMQRHHYSKINIYWY